MTDRSAMDRPAMVAAALLGVLLIAVSLPFLVGDGGARSYDVAWHQVELGSEDAAFAGNGQSQEVELTVTGLISNVTVTLECSDVRPAPQAQPAASITWTLYEDNRSISDGTTSCDPGDVERVNRTSRPDVGTAHGSSPAAVARALAADNETRHYRLEFTWSRPQGQVPTLPVGAPTFAGRMGLEAEGWQATVNPPEEATR